MISLILLQEDNLVQLELKMKARDNGQSIITKCLMMSC